jgi:hypothetical protein
MAKPGDFYVGIITFFAILLPGSAGVGVLVPMVDPKASGRLFALPSGGLGEWIAFLLAAYFLGHLIFLAGSYIDWIYNALRERFHPYTNESAYRCATAIRDHLISEGEHQALNTFQWARAVLMALFPEAAADVQALEADSKFFRSLLVVLVLSASVLFAQGHLGAGGLALAFLAPCFARYYERRLKSTTQAYIYIVSLHRLGKLQPMVAP